MFYVGVDLGKRRDHSAIAVVEKVLEYSPYASPTMSSMDVRLLERVPLGTPFPVVVNAVRELVRSDALRGRCAVAVDATGMGGPVVDMLKRAQLGCELTAVTITGGDRQTGGGSEYGIPKRDLIAGVQVLLELGQLRIARKLPNAGALMRELLNGEQSVEQRRRADELAAARRIYEGGDGEEGCDPVLRFHYRL